MLRALLVVFVIIITQAAHISSQLVLRAAATYLHGVPLDVRPDDEEGIIIISPLDGVELYAGPSATLSLCICFQAVTHSSGAAIASSRLEVDGEAITIDQAPGVAIAEGITAGQHVVTVEVDLIDGRRLKSTASFTVASLFARPYSAIAFNLGHESAISVAVNGELISVLQVSRLYQMRYWQTSAIAQEFIPVWREAVAILGRTLGDLMPALFQAGVLVHPFPVYKLTNNHAHLDLHFVELLAAVVQAQDWQIRDHHEMHAIDALLSSPFDRAAILSYDGGGNDGTFNIYVGERHELGTKKFEVTRVMQQRYRLGQTYNCFSKHIAELDGDWDTPGGMMDLATTGSIRQEWVPVLLEMLTDQSESRSCAQLAHQFDRLPAARSASSDKFSGMAARDIACTLQEAMRSLVAESLAEVLQRMPSRTEAEPAVVLTGGCAYNVKINEWLRQKYSGRVWVPVAPTDSGLTIGGGLAPFPDAPGAAQRPYGTSPYMGLLPFDTPDLEKLLRSRHTTTLYDGGIDGVAALLAAGSTVAVMVGAEELGLRSLGHRSILAVPLSSAVRARLNGITGRPAFRTISVIMPQSLCTELFGAPLYSPFASYAPLLERRWIHRWGSSASEELLQAVHEAVTGADGRVAVQTVAPAGTADTSLDSSKHHWVQRLVFETVRLTGVPFVFNTELMEPNGQRSLVNSYASAIGLFDSEPQLDALVADDWLMQREHGAEL